MLELKDVVSVWNSRWGGRLSIINYDRDCALIGFSSQLTTKVSNKPHYEFLIRKSVGLIMVGLHKEDGYNNPRDPNHQRLESLVRELEQRIKAEVKDIGLNIDKDDIIGQKTERYFWLNIKNPRTAAADLVCDCMEKLICVTYQRFAEYLGVSPMHEFSNIAKKWGSARQVESKSENNTEIVKNTKERSESQKHPIYPDDLPDDSPEYLEGNKKSVLVNIYERNPKAREECINHYGAACSICGLDFGKTYGSEFAGMIHVHHLKMVSQADGRYTIDPVKDLLPVCPNCHMVLHSKGKGEVYTIKEVKAMLG